MSTIVCAWHITAVHDVAALMAAINLSLSLARWVTCPKGRSIEPLFHLLQLMPTSPGSAPPSRSFQLAFKADNYFYACLACLFRYPKYLIFCVFTKFISQCSGTCNSSRTDKFVLLAVQGISRISSKELIFLSTSMVMVHVSHA